MPENPRKLQHAKIETLDFITAEMRCRAPATAFAVEVGGKRYSGDAEFGVGDDGVFVIRFLDKGVRVADLMAEVTGDGSA
mgnify:CR=1 FL=1